MMMWVLIVVLSVVAVVKIRSAVIRFKKARESELERKRKLSKWLELRVSLYEPNQSLKDLNWIFQNEKVQSLLSFAVGEDGPGRGGITEYRRPNSVRGILLDLPIQEGKIPVLSVDGRPMIVTPEGGVGMLPFTEESPFRGGDVLRAISRRWDREMMDALVFECCSRR